MKAEDLGVIHEGQSLNVLAIALDLRAKRRHVVRVVARHELKVGGEALLGEPRLAVRVEEAPIPIVGDLASVLHVAHHVVDRDPVDGAPLGLHHVEVVLHVRDARREVGLRELVQDVEAERAELAPLLHDGVHEGEREEHRLPLRVADRVEHVLVEPRVRVAHAEHDARGRLVRELDRELQQANREVGVGLCSDPQAVGRQHRARGGVLELGQRLGPLHELAHKRETEVAILEQHPDALADAHLEQLACGRLLSLAHRDALDALLALAA